MFFYKLQKFKKKLREFITEINFQIKKKYETGEIYLSDLEYFNVSLYDEFLSFLLLNLVGDKKINFLYE